MLGNSENFATSAVQKAGRWKRAPVARAPDGTVAERPAAMKRLRGRLNVFQATMLDWRELHPYNAVHAVRIEERLAIETLARAVDDTLEHAGLTGLELDRGRARYEWHGGPSHAEIERIEARGDWQQTLATTFERHLNQAFPVDGRIDPFRFFAIDAGDAFFVGVAYDHFIAGGDSIIALLNAIADRYAGRNAIDGTMSLYPPTHRRLLLRHPLRFARGIRRLPAMAASCRRTIRPRYRSLEDGHNAFTFFMLEPSRYVALRAAAKAWGVTLNDALLALLLLAQDAQMPERDRSKRRSEFAVASIMNLRDAHGLDVQRTFGQFLSSFRVSHPVPPGITLQELAQDVHRATSRIKRERLYLTTLSAIAIDRMLARFQDRQQRLGVYAKSYPVGAGISSLNVNALWRGSGDAAPLYVRGVPTGPASPLVIAVTTSGDTLCAGVSYRTTAFTADAVARIRDDMIHRIQGLS
jgi:hypothetical protein